MSRESTMASCSPGIALALVDRLSDIGAVVEHPVQVLLVDPVARAACGCRASPTSRASSVQDPISRKRAKIQRTCSARSLVDDQFPVLDAVAVGRHAAHPHALLAAGGNLVADALGRHLALELGEREQDVQRQPDHGRGRIEGLRDRDEGHTVAVEHFHQLGEIRQRAAEPVDLVDHDDVDQPVPRCPPCSRFRPGRSSVPPEMPPSSY